MANSFFSISSNDQTAFLIKAFGILTVASILLGVALETFFTAAIPAFALLVYMTIVDFRKVFYFLFFCLPIATDISLPGGLSTDLPSEPLMVGLMFVYILYLIQHGKEMSSDFIRHPISILLLIHLFWTFATTITSELFLVSLKFSLAKTWYIIVFYFMVGTMIKTKEQFKTVFWAVVIPTALIIVIVLAKHSAHGFSFKMVNYVMEPFFKNHVDYASTLALLIPFIWYARTWYEKKSTRWWQLVALLLLFIIGVQFSYTRAAYVGILGSIAVVYFIRLRLMKWLVAISIVATIALVSIFIDNNRYLDFAPEFKKTVTHHNFDNLLEATFKMEDISTMERVYRWVAGGHMVPDHMYMGFGPGNFYNFYRPYTVSSFKTYVSDNPEKSGIHSYFLMVLVEQGFFGLLFFAMFNFYILIKGENIYHEVHSIDRKNIVMTAILSIVVINSLLLINDMIESDKVGTFYFACVAIIVNMDLMDRKERNEIQEETNQPTLS